MAHRAGLKAGEAGPEVTLNLGRSGASSEGVPGSLLGPAPPALVPALWGRTVDGWNGGPEGTVSSLIYSKLRCRRDPNCRKIHVLSTALPAEVESRTQSGRIIYDF